jgi:hypothetical protein
MSAPELRMTQRDHVPTESELVGWIGERAHRYWQEVTRLIEEAYPGVFAPEWLYGGQKHGWSLRYKRSKPLCTLVPERDGFALMIVFGAEERAKVEAIKDSLSQHTIDEYEAATTYHDGKWLLLKIDNDDVVKDVTRLWATKRKPKSNLSARGE